MTHDFTIGRGWTRWVWGAVAVVTLVVVGWGTLPEEAAAWETTAQSATQLTDDTWLFSVTYRMAFLNRETELPILADRRSVPNPLLPTVQYDIVDAAGNTLTGARSTAIVLSDTPLIDRQYFLPSGRAGFFTLTAVVQLSPELVAADGTVQLRINWLPFTLTREGVVQQARVPEADLVNFVTPVATWTSVGGK
jgi:hypothetical protein